MRVTEQYKEFPILFKKSKTGAIQQCVICALDDVVRSVSGRVGHKQKATDKIVTQKNVGRANETSLFEQACLQAQAKWKKKTEEGYFETVEEALNEVVLLPMLAGGKFEEVKDKIEYPVIVQPKYDGVRCLAVSDNNGDVTLLSRTGKEYELKHIKEQLKGKIPFGMVLDGEVYLHGIGFNNLMKLVKKTRPETKNLNFVLYDMFKISNPRVSNDVRLEELTTFYVTLNTTNILLAPSFLASNSEDVTLWKTHFLRQGYEGGIIRIPSAYYTIGHRSRELIKDKNFQDEEFEIVGFSFYQVDYQDAMIDQIKWECKTKEGLTFEVVPAGSVLERNNQCYKATEELGNFLVVKFFEKSEDGIPRFPVGKGIRLNKDIS